MNKRALYVLKNLIENYIQVGQPVGSKVLAQESNLLLSSASIRNIMAELETAGFLKSPHTSSGRIPTAKGFRLFVDHFVTVQPFAQTEVEHLREQLSAESDAQRLIAQASSLISDVTGLVGVVTLPKREKLILKQVEFLSLSTHRVLVILVFNNREVQNRVIHTHRHYSRSELEQVGNYLTQHFAGKDLGAVRKKILNEMKKDQRDIDEMIHTVVEMAEKTVTKEDNFFISGETHLLDNLDETNYQQLKRLFSAFSKKRDMLHLLDQVLQAEGVKLFIGEESGYLDDCALVAAPYSEGDKIVGVLGVIGPTRMPYHKVVSVVDITAKLLSQALKVE